MNRQTPLFGLLFLVALAAWQLATSNWSPSRPPRWKIFNRLYRQNLVTTRFNESGEAHRAAGIRICGVLPGSSSRPYFTKPVAHMFDEQGRPNGRSPPKPGAQHR